jgi:nicotinate phosphoribosyltransferase
VQLVKEGKIVGEEPLETIRQRHIRVRAELPLEALKMSRGEPVINTVYAGVGESGTDTHRTNPSGELPATSNAGEPIAGPNREL